MPFVQTKNDANGDVDEERGVEEKNAVLPNHERPTNKWSFDFVGELASAVVSRLSRPIICCIFNFSRFSCFNLNFPILCGGVEVEPILCPLLDERSQ